METAHLKDILPYICEKTLVVFDVDNTLIEPGTPLGSHQWSDNYLSRLMAKGMGEREAIETTISLWKAIVPDLPFKLVTDATPMFLDQIKALGALPIGLTARSPYEKDFTREHLMSVGLDFTHEISPPKTSFSHKSGEWAFSEGVIFKENFTPKGKALSEFLHEYDLDHEKIIFVDDRVANVLSVLKWLKGHRASVLGVRYSQVDATLEAFDEELVRQEEANLVKKRPELSVYPLLNEQECGGGVSI